MIIELLITFVSTATPLGIAYIKYAADKRKERKEIRLLKEKEIQIKKEEEEKKEKKRIEIDNVQNKKIDTIGETLLSIDDQLKIFKDQLKVLRDDRKELCAVFSFSKELDEILVDALNFSSNIKLNSYINYKIRLIKETTSNIITIYSNINDINPIVIKNNINQLIDDFYLYCREIIDVEFADMIKERSSFLTDKLENEILEAITDSVFNNKKSRFFRSILSFIRANLGLTIKVFNEYSNNKN